MKAKTLTALSVTGLFVAAGSWALHQQIDYVLASLACTRGSRLLWIVTLLAVVLVVVALAMTLRVPRSHLAALRRSAAQRRSYVAGFAD